MSSTTQFVKDSRIISRSRIPGYRLHKATGQAVVVLGGTSIYLGRYGSPESHAKYDQVITRYLAARSQRADPSAKPIPGSGLEPNRSLEPLSVEALVLRYWRFAKGYYRKNDQPTGEIHPLRQVLRLLRRHHGETLACEFGPLALKKLQDVMVELPLTRKVKVVDANTGEVRYEERVVQVGMARRTINKQIGRVKRVFAWAVAEELLPAPVHEALPRVDGLRKGRSSARETPRVRPVLDEHVDAVLPHVPPTVAAMIRVQRLTGCRPQEVVLMQAVDITRTDSAWEYRPTIYKSEHKNEDGNADLERVIYLGPRAQAVISPLLPCGQCGYLFRPGRANRNQPAAAAQQPRAHYSVAGYRQAIKRGCLRAGVPVWFPQQLRHSAGTAIRQRYGVEGAQAVLGHRELGVTQVYAEVNREAARQAMLEIG